jgi:hypothetical protein
MQIGAFCNCSTRPPRASSAVPSRSASYASAARALISTVAPSNAAVVGGSALTRYSALALSCAFGPPRLRKPQQLELFPRWVVTFPPQCSLAPMLLGWRPPHW